jgi:hypothetical protein
MISEHDLDRIDHLARGDGLDPATTPFDQLTEWLQLAAGCHARQHAEDVVRLLKVRALARAS